MTWSVGRRRRSSRRREPSRANFPACPLRVLSQRQQPNAPTRPTRQSFSPWSLGQVASAACRTVRCQPTASPVTAYGSPCLHPSRQIFVAFSSSPSARSSVSACLSVGRCCVFLWFRERSVGLALTSHRGLSVKISVPLRAPDLCWFSFCLRCVCLSWVSRFFVGAGEEPRMVRLTGIRTGSSRRKHLYYFSPSCLRVRSLLREPACERALGGLAAGLSSRNAMSVTSNHNPWKRHL